MTFPGRCPRPCTPMRCSEIDMSLVLSLRQSHHILVGGCKFVVVNVSTPYRFMLQREDGRLFQVSDSRWTYIKKDVKVQAGVPRKQDSRIVSLLLDAPNTIRILRGELEESVQTSACVSCGGTKVIRVKELCQTCGGHSGSCVSCNGTGMVLVSSKCPDCGST